MAAVSNLSIPDGQATPVAHIFSPARTTSDYAEFEDRVAGIYVGFNRIKIQLRRPNGQPAGKAGSSEGRNLKLQIKLETPKLEVVSNATVSGIAPAPTVSYRPVCDLNVTFPERCALQDRKDLRAMLVNLLLTPTAIAAFEQYELPY